MKTERLRIEPLLAQLSVKIPSEKPQKESNVHRATRCTPGSLVKPRRCPSSC